MSTATKRAEKAASENRRRRALHPPKTAQASSQARRQAAAILEVLAGLRRPAEAAQVLGISLVRYYLWERRALDGLLAACEPAPRGPRPDLSRQVRRLEKEIVRLQRDCSRQQALVRAAERSLGLAVSAVDKPQAAGKKQAESPGANGKRKRRPRRPTVRALRAARALRAEEPTPAAEDGAAVAPPETTAAVDEA